MKLRQFLIWGLHLYAVIAVEQTIHLDYATYQGQAVADGITQWLGMRYAAPPVGSLRFAAPLDPPYTPGIQSADKHGRTCLATGDSPWNPGTSEDCLFIDVYAPTSASVKSELPIYFFIQGGGFNFNSNANYNGAGLVAGSGHEILVVTFNYRVGPYGFLASQQVIDSPTGCLNNGLLDQRKALEWVQNYIHFFGGDPTHVVVGGDSAGAASIAHHLTAYGARDDALFVAVAAESVSFAPILTVQESQYQYDYLANQLGCGSSTKIQDVLAIADPLACLRSKSAIEIQTFNRPIPYSGNMIPPLFMWNPVIDGELLRDYTRSAVENGNFIRVPMLFGDDNNAGTIFSPKGTSSLAQSHSFLRQQYPQLTPDQLAQIARLYPNVGPDFPHTGIWWRQVSDVYGDLRYMCPNLFMSLNFARFGLAGNWNYRYNVEDSAQMVQGYGVPHTAELPAIWGPFNTNGAPASYYPGRENAWIVPMMQQYWISFIRTLDPNTLKAVGSPIWETFTDPDEVDKVDDAEWRRMLFDTSTTTGMESVSESIRTKCQYLNEIGLALRQ